MFLNYKIFITMSINYIKDESYYRMDNRIYPDNVVEFVSGDPPSIKRIFNRIKKIKSKKIGIKFDADGFNIVCNNDKGIGLHVILPPKSFKWFMMKQEMLFIVSKDDLCRNCTSYPRVATDKAMVVFSGRSGCEDLITQYFPSESTQSINNYPHTNSEDIDKCFLCANAMIEDLKIYQCIVMIPAYSFQGIKTKAKSEDNNITIMWEPENGEIIVSSNNKTSTGDGVNKASIIRFHESRICRTVDISALVVFSSLIGTSSKQLTLYLHETLGLVIEFESDEALFRCTFVNSFL
jgi:hypothetical protein